MSINAKLNNLLEKTIPGLGYEVVDVEVTPTRLIRVYIDKQDGTSITIGDCEIVSDHLSKLFVVEEIDYNRLEISSPGVERPLKRLTDFIRFKGKLAKIKTILPINDNKVFQGIIHDVDGDFVLLQLEGNAEIFKCDFNSIQKARLVFEHKSGQAKGQAKNKNGTKHEKHKEYNKIE